MNFTQENAKSSFVEADNIQILLYPESIVLPEASLRVFGLWVSSGPGFDQLLL